MKEILVPAANSKELPAEMYGVKLTPYATIEEAMKIMLVE